MLDMVKARLQSFGYEIKDGDETILNFCIQKVESSIKNDCNVSSIPDGLVCIAVDMAVGEFLTAKKTFSSISKWSRKTWPREAPAKIWQPWQGHCRKAAPTTVP